MLTTKEIHDKAERAYSQFLLSVLRREVFFPFHIKGNKGNANLPLQELYPALKHLIDHSKEKIGYGFSLTYKEVNTRHSGIITMPEAIFFENPQDFLKFIDKEQAFIAFRKAVDLTRRQVPTLLTWIEDNALKVQKNADDWADILKVVTYFIQHPRPDCYWRQLPISVDLSNMEAHQALIGDLLNAVLPPLVIAQTEQRFEPRFGLRYDEPMLSIRFLDAQQTSIFGKNIALPLSKFSIFSDFEVIEIFLIADKNVFLSFPERAKSIAIWWEHGVDVLSKIRNWQGKIYTLLDIAPKSFVQLSEMRAILPSLHPILMDKTTFEAFSQHHQTQKVTQLSTFLVHLTSEEQRFYQELLSLEEKNTLLQKDISYSFLEKKILELC
jgi:hypothetical protein